MNGLSQHIADDDDRTRIASRSDINVFVPKLDDSRYVSDLAGDYWPHRSVTLKQACEQPKAVERTRRRTQTLRLVDNRPPGSNFPMELFETADDAHVDEVLPASYSGTARDAIADAVRLYSNYDFRTEPTLLVPVVAPYELTGACIKHLLYETDHTSGLRSINNPTDFAVRGLSSRTQSYEQFKEILTTIEDVLKGGVNLNIHAPHVSADLVRIVRNHNGLINSVTLPHDTAGLATTESTSYLSAKGTENLTADSCPLVQLAGELSLLTSDLIDDDQVASALAESSIPELAPETPKPDAAGVDRQSTFS
ncbi:MULTISPECIES: hypothetical protein [Haloferacaceae]|uniref:Uncharacterized protein n=2 Tax=Haloferacaceae TaxID=1644056 RepID=A0ABD6DB19_9EURY|nr:MULTISPECIES: hypothetical protein [Halorubraceae]